MNDLMALTVVRRLLLELGYELQPEHVDSSVGPLWLWLHEPRPELAGATPLAALQVEDGEAKVRLCLRSLVDQRESSRSAGSAPSDSEAGRPDTAPGEK